MLGWNTEGVQIPDVVEANIDGWINGTAHYRNLLFHWRAQAQPGGYYVEVETLNGRKLSGNGSTFNLMLEVAAMVKRL